MPHVEVVEAHVLLLNLKCLLSTPMRSCDQQSDCKSAMHSCTWRCQPCWRAEGSSP